MLALRQRLDRLDGESESGALSATPSGHAAGGASLGMPARLEGGAGAKAELSADGDLASGGDGAMHASP